MDLYTLRNTDVKPTYLPQLELDATQHPLTSISRYLYINLCICAVYVCINVCMCVQCVCCVRVSVID